MNWVLEEGSGKIRSITTSENADNRDRGGGERVRGGGEGEGGSIVSKMRLG